MQTNELNEAELATQLKDACAAPATPKKDVEDAVWQRVSKSLDRTHDTKVLAPAAPRRLWRWCLAATTVAAALLIAVLLIHRRDLSWEMAEAPRGSAHSVSRPVPAVEGEEITRTAREKRKVEEKTAQVQPSRLGDDYMPDMKPGDHWETRNPESSDTASVSDDARFKASFDGEVDASASKPGPGSGSGFGGGDGVGARSRDVAARRVTPPAASSDPKLDISRPIVGAKELESARGPMLAPPPIEEKGQRQQSSEKPAEPAKRVIMDEAESSAARSAYKDVVKLRVPDGEDVSGKKSGPEVTTDTRGNKTIEELKAKAEELERKIAEAERADKATSRPSPYANIQDPKPNVQVLSGGTQDDNADFAKFQDFLSQTNAPGAIKQDISERVMIEISDAQGLPLTNADVRIVSNGRTIHKARTYSNGTALFFPRVVGADPQSQDFRVEVVPPPGCSGQTVTQDFRGRSGSWRLQVPYARTQNATKLDILLCLDCTGSMADEIERIQKTLQMMVAKFNALPGKPQTRWGLVQYRDRGDQYVTQVHDFTDDVQKFQKKLDECKADAGGDEPESVNEALDKAVEGVSWDRSDAIRLVFLVGDAPPHMDYRDDVKYTESMAKAQRRAIKIYPLAASGLNKTGEVIFRQMAQYTLARFLFISYGGSTPHEVSKPGQSNNLDDLIVHIVADEVNARVSPIRQPFQIEDPDRWQK